MMVDLVVQEVVHLPIPHPVDLEPQEQPLNFRLTVMVKEISEAEVLV
jgi:hypothetical protein